MGKPTEADVNDEAEDFVDELKPGTELMHGQYTIESFLNAGGFGITYLAKDSLDRKIVIKECFPGAFCRRSRSIVQARSRAHQPELQSIVRLFVQEAKSLAKLNHPNIVGVHQVFEDNDTAYMALDFVEGRDMLDTLDDPDSTMTPDQIKSMLVDVLGAVKFIHDQDILHRDISPDNILIEPSGRPVLIDFGAAREQATKQSRVLSALRVVKDGYSPQEFYIAGSEQNESSDLYALGASFYHFIKGDVPPNSQARLAAIASGEPDPYEPLAGAIDAFDVDFLKALDKSLEVLPKDRVQSAQDWLDMMDGKVTNAAVAPAVAGSAGASPVDAAVAASAPAAESKSKIGLLMASAAVIAVVGVGAAMTLGGGGEADDAADAEAQATPTPTSEDVAVADTAEADAQKIAEEEAQRVAAAEAQAEAEAEAQRLAEAEAQAAAAQQLAAAEAAAEAEAQRIALAEAERVARAEELARIAEEEAAHREEQAALRAEAEAAAEEEARLMAQAQAQAEAEAEAAAEARALAEAQAAQEAEDAAQAEARRVAEAEAAKAEAEAAEAAKIAAVKAAEAQAKAEAAALAAATLDTPTPPNDIENVTILATLAGAPQLPLAAFNANLPEDVSFGQALTDQQVAAMATSARVPDRSATPDAPNAAGDDAGLPDFTANAPDAADGFNSLTNLPDGVPTIASVALPLIAPIPAFTPGNEIIPEPDPIEEAFVLSAWSVELPFEGTSSSSRVIGTVAPIAPIWVDRGVEINSVNGREIESIAEINELLRDSVELADEKQLLLSFGITGNDAADTSEQEWTVPIIQQTALLNGIGFETRMVGDEWVTRVTAAPEDVSGDLKVGDQIIAYMKTSEKVDTRTSLKSIMDREIAEGTSQFSFAVRRDETMWIASLDYAQGPQ